MTAASNPGASAATAVFVGLFMVVWVASVAFWIVALVDCVKRPDWQYQAVGSSKTSWVLVVTLAGAIGGLVYWLDRRPKLRAVEEQQRRSGWWQPGQWPGWYGYGPPPGQWGGPPPPPPPPTGPPGGPSEP